MTGIDFLRRYFEPETMGIENIQGGLPIAGKHRPIEARGQLPPPGSAVLFLISE